MEGEQDEAAPEGVETEGEGDETPDAGAEATAGGAKAPKEEEGWDPFGTEVPEWWGDIQKRLGTSGKQFRVGKDDLARIQNDEALRSLHYNMRNDYTSKTKTLADERRKLEEERRTHAAEVAKFNQGRASFHSAIPKGLEHLKTPEGEAPPPWTPEGIEYQVKKLLAEHMAPFREHVGKSAEEAQAAVQKYEAETAQAARMQEIETFAKEHPDFDDMIDDIKELRAKHPGLTAEMAYWGLKGQGKGAQEKPSALDVARANSQRASGRPGRGGKARLPSDAELAKMSGQDIARLLAENPELQREALAGARR